MGHAASAPDVLLIDFSRIVLTGDDNAPDIVTIRPEDGFFLNESFTSDFRIRKSIYDMLLEAREGLPEGRHFMIYEAYRPLARQVALWNRATEFLKKEYPDADEARIRALTETFVADPYNGIGSGHQACCAIDISLCDANGREYDMGTKCQEISPLSPTRAAGISGEARHNREILVKALEKTGLVNYPAEWWHFSYGDHQWAYLTNRTEACFGPIDI